RLGQDDQAEEAEIDPIVERKFGVFPMDRPQMYELARKEPSPSQVGEEQVTVLTHSGTDRVLPPADSLVMAAGCHFDDIMLRTPQLKGDLLAQSNRVLKDHPARRCQDIGCRLC